MKMRIERIPGVRGFIGTTYAVFQGQKAIKVFLTKKEAENFIKEEESK